MKYRSKGMVYLVGAGPGDPDLITAKGTACLKAADVIVYDHLVDESLLSLSEGDAEIIYVGKISGEHTMSQEDINKLLIRKAMEGLTVARLKGGDPFIFGRGGEEALELSKAGIKFEIVPGVTSAVAVPAYAGIPLTHRNFSSNVCMVTGHEDPFKQDSAVNWETLARDSGTLVFLMGIGKLDKIAAILTEKGRPLDSPVAVIENGTMPTQRTITGTLNDIADRVKEAGLKPPGVIVVGEVANLRGYINWFESKPLFGKRILVTRPRDQARDFIRQLSELGAQCIPFPTIEAVPPPSWRELDRAIENISGYDWILFTSVNGVKYFFNRLENAKKDARHLNGISIGAIGPKTAEVLIYRGIRPDLVPRDYWSERLVEELDRYNVKGKRFLLPRPVAARDYIPRELRDMGAVVDIAEAYRTVQPELGQDMINELNTRANVDMITFTSPSTVSNLLNIFREKASLNKISGADIACIGPVTAQKATDSGLKVSLISREYNIGGLARAIAEFYDNRSGAS